MAGLSSSGRAVLLRRGAVVAGGLLLSSTGSAAFAAPAVRAAPLMLYVASNGSDMFNNCEDASLPCRTIAQAIDTAKSDSEAEIVILITGGASYEGGETISLREDQSLTIEPAAGTGEVTVNGTGRGTSVFTIDHSHVVLRGLTISGGNAAVNGGGVESDNSTVTLADDRIINNSADNSGGGIYNVGGAILRNDTITGNGVAGFTGAGVFNASGGTLELTGVTLWDDRQSTRIVPGGALHSQNSAPGAVRIAGSIVGEPQDYYPGEACVGRIEVPVGGAGGRNAVTDQSCSAGADDVISTPAQLNLQPLAANGSTGPQTVAFGLPSTAFAVVPTASGICLPTDERGKPRPASPATAATQARSNCRTSRSSRPRRRLPAAARPPSLETAAGISTRRCETARRGRAASRPRLPRVRVQTPSRRTSAVPRSVTAWRTLWPVRTVEIRPLPRRIAVCSLTDVGEQSRRRAISPVLHGPAASIRSRIVARVRPSRGIRVRGASGSCSPSGSCRRSGTNSTGWRWAEPKCPTHGLPTPKTVGWMSRPRPFNRMSASTVLATCSTGGAQDSDGCRCCSRCAGPAAASCAQVWRSASASAAICGIQGSSEAL